MTFFGYEKELLWGYTATILHECAHLCASIYLKSTPISITFGVCGMNLETQRVTDTLKHIKILATGPVFSFGMFGALFFLRKSEVISAGIFEFANLCIGLVNLFPATPLDGGRMLKLYFSSRFGIIWGGKIMKSITLVMISLIMLLNAFLILSDSPNPFLFIFLSFLIFSFFKEKREDILLKNRVFSGQVISAKKTKVICFKSDSRLSDIASRVSPSYYLVGVIFEKGKFLGEIHQKDIPYALKTMGAMGVAKEFIKAKNEVKSINAIEKTDYLLYNK